MSHEAARQGMRVPETQLPRPRLRQGAPPPHEVSHWAPLTADLWSVRDAEPDSLR